jgi:hypothetical protein
MFSISAVPIRYNFPTFLVITIIPPLILNFCDGSSTSRYIDYAMSWMVQGSNPSRAKRFLFLFSPKSPDWLCGPRRLLFNGYQVLPRGGVVKQSGCEINHSPPSSAVVKNKRSYTCTSPYSFMVWTGKAYFHLVYFIKVYDNNPEKCQGTAWKLQKL